MNIKNMKESCEIFEKYGLEKEWFEADHDIIYGPDFDDFKTEISKEDKVKLDELGWFEDDECWSCFC